MAIQIRFKASNRISGSHVDRECSFSKIDRQIKDNAYQALQVAEKQEFKTSETGGVMDALDSLIGQLSIFSLSLIVLIMMQRLPNTFRL